MPNMEIVLANDTPGLGKAGERVTLALTPADVSDTTEISTYLGGYRPFGNRADEVSPPILKPDYTGKYRNFSANDAFQQAPVKASHQSAIPEVDPRSTLTSFTAVQRLIGSFVPAQTQRVAASGSNPNYDPRMAAGRRCKTVIELDREIDTWDLLSTVSNWAAGVVTAVPAGDEWNVGGNPIDVLQDAILKSFMQVTGIWLNQRVAFDLIKHPEVRLHMRQFYGDAAINGQVANVANAGSNGAGNVDFTIPGFPPFHVVASKKLNESTGLLDFVLPNVVVLEHQPQGVPIDGEDAATTYTFRYSGESGTGTDSREFFVENRGPYGGTMMVVAQADVAVMVANNVGGLVTNVRSS